MGIEPNQRPARGIYKPHRGQPMAEFKLSIDTDDPEIFLKALVLAAHALDMSPLFAEAVNSGVPDMEYDLSGAIDLLTRCANGYAEYKREVKEIELDAKQND